MMLQFIGISYRTSHVKSDLMRANSRLMLVVSFGVDLLSFVALLVGVLLVASLSFAGPFVLVGILLIAEAALGFRVSRMLTVDKSTKAVLVWLVLLSISRVVFLAYSSTYSYPPMLITIVATQLVFAFVVSLIIQRKSQAIAGE
jgi:hypothetical protein